MSGRISSDVAADDQENEDHGLIAEDGGIVTIEGLTFYDGTHTLSGEVTVGGDLIVGDGTNAATLRLEAGTEVRFAATDAESDGQDPGTGGADRAGDADRHGAGDHLPLDQRGSVLPGVVRDPRRERRRGDAHGRHGPGWRALCEGGVRRHPQPDQGGPLQLRHVPPGGRRPGGGVCRAGGGHGAHRPPGGHLPGHGRGGRRGQLGPGGSRHAAVDPLGRGRAALSRRIPPGLRGAGRFAGQYLPGDGAGGGQSAGHYRVSGDGDGDQRGRARERGPVHGDAAGRPGGDGDAARPGRGFGGACGGLAVAGSSAGVNDLGDPVGQYGGSLGAAEPGGAGALQLHAGVRTCGLAAAGGGQPL